DVLFGRRPRLAVVGRNASDELLDDALQARALADRLSTSAAELDAVVLGRIVGGGEHRTRALPHARRVVELVGAGQTEVHGIQSLSGHALDEGGGQTRGAIAHIVADDHALRAFRAHEASERGTNVTD